jgi:DMSO/TMAO reductase YedYZ heme-binding membrane subunit
MSLFASELVHKIVLVTGIINMVLVIVLFFTCRVFPSSSLKWAWHKFLSVSFIYLVVTYAFCYYSCCPSYLTYIIGRIKTIDAETLTIQVFNQFQIVNFKMIHYRAFDCLKVGAYST